MLAADLAVDQLVWVSHPHDTRRYPAKLCPVVKVGRKLVTIQVDGRDVQFRLDRQIINDGTGYTRFDTKQQWEDKLKATETESFFRRVGMDFRISSQIANADRVKIAEFVKSLGYGNDEAGSLPGAASPGRRHCQQDRERHTCRGRQPAG